MRRHRKKNALSKNCFENKVLSQICVNLNNPKKEIIMKESRLIGGYPVIGIRPIIDARQGILKVRQSLEEQTMGTAKKLFKENLIYSNGEPVKVVISDTTIGRGQKRHSVQSSLKKKEWTLPCL